jgi:hypothetical protein
MYRARRCGLHGRLAPQPPPRHPCVDPPLVEAEHRSPGVAGAGMLKQREDGNTLLQRPIADPNLDGQILHRVLR